MPCICYGAVTGQEEFDKFIQSEEGQSSLTLLRQAARIINQYELSPECYKDEFQKIFIDAFSHMLNGCPELINNPKNMSEIKKIQKVLELIIEFGQIDGDHHKAWVIDQIVRVLTAKTYDYFVQRYKDGEDGPDTYDWDEGIAP